MKKPGIIALSLVCCLFLGLVTGFFLGRNINKFPVQISKIPDVTENTTNPTDNVEIRIININTATVEELTALPGIGEVLAGRIIQERNENGSFHSIDDILRVNGIGETTLNNIRNYITAED